MRLIDADALKDRFQNLAYDDWNQGTSTSWADAFLECADMVDEQPTIELERKTGKWVHGREIAREMVGDAVAAIFYEGWQCSECKCIVEEEREPLWNFCPNCGADMRGGQDENR